MKRWKPFVTRMLIFMSGIMIGLSFVKQPIEASAFEVLFGILLCLVSCLYDWENTNFGKKKEE